MSFDELTKEQRVPVLRSVALEVLRRRFGLEPTGLDVVSLSFNTLFRVDRADGPPLVLRVCGRQRIHEAGVEAVEAHWLLAISTDLGWAVPQMVPALDGSLVVEASHPAVPRAVPCSLFSWVDGQPVDDHPDAATAGRLGGLLAEMHGHAATLSIPTPTGVRADRTVRFGEPAVVAALDPLLAEAIDRGQQFLDDLWSSPGRPHLLHGDFGPSNVLRWRDRLTPIDYQDLQLGHAVQDVGITIADLVDDDVEPVVVDAFRRGYEEAGGEAITDEQVATFGALRALDLIGFCLASPRPGLDETIADSIATIQAWMRG